MSEVLTDDWFKCYGQAWGNLCVPAAVAHPAKFSRKLIFRIFEHAIEKGWVKPGDTCIDIFGGVALGGLPAMLNGLHWVGVELEARFCALAQANIDLWNKRYAEQMPNWGTAIIVQGDSRRLGEVLARAELCLSSPPYGNATKNLDDIDNWDQVKAARIRDMQSMSRSMMKPYSHNPANLGNLPDTGFEAALAVASPPWQGGTQSVSNMPVTGKLALKRGGTAGGKSAHPVAEGYGSEPGQLAQMREGSFDLALSSPVYIGNTASDDPDKRGGLYRDPKRRNDKALTATYSEDEAQLAQMPEGDLALALGSPPYIGTPVSAQGADGKSQEWNKAYREYQRTGNHAKFQAQMTKKCDKAGYGISDGQLAALPEGDHAAACERPAIAISSPPYEGIRQDGGGEYAKAGMGGIRPYTDEPVDTWFTQRDQRNLGNMRPGDHAEALEAGAVTGRAQCAISSPPHMSTTCRGAQDPIFAHKFRGNQRYSDEDPRDPKHTLGGDRNSPKAIAAREIRAAGTRNLGEIVVDSGATGLQHTATFWAASREILEQVYQVLAPGGHCIFVCKRFVRDKKIVEFPTQWAHLCEAVGFTWIHHHKAWLVEDRGAQHTLDGGLEERQVKRMSFFRRLHSQKYPHLEILWEDVLCFVKPKGGDND